VCPKMQTKEHMRKLCLSKERDSCKVYILDGVTDNTMDQKTPKDDSKVISVKKLDPTPVSHSSLPSWR
jgi:hypothetical protein